MKLSVWFLCLLVISSLSWFVWSFTQVDLNLTLIRFEPFFSIIDALKKIGVFHRPTATVWFVLTWLGLWIGYFGLIKSVNFTKISFGNVIKVLLIISFAITLSYPATSYDLFNYMFDAKIVSEYGLNPYRYTAQDFPNDEWVRFMHWTHRTYPYGPIWLVMTVPLVALGHGVWLLTFLLFKLLVFASYLLTARAIYFLACRIRGISSAKMLTIAFMAHPLVLVEGLSAAHIDIVMSALAVTGIWLLASRRMLGSVMLIAGGLVKFVTLAWLPAFVFSKLSLELQLKIATALGLVATGVVMLEREVLAWYLLPSLALILLVSRRTADLLWWLMPGLTIRYALLYWYGSYTDAHLAQRLDFSVTLLLLGCLGFVVFERFFKAHTSR